MFNDNQLREKNGTSATISVGNWLGLDAIGFLTMIPIVGAIAAIIIYIVMLCSTETAPSIKNRIIACIIWSAIGLAFSAVLIGIAVAIGLNSADALKSFIEENAAMR